MLVVKCIVMGLFRKKETSVVATPAMVPQMNDGNYSAMAELTLNARMAFFWLMGLVRLNSPIRPRRPWRDMAARPM